MMIDALLQQHEGKTLDFKQDLRSPRGVLKTLVAFANSAGGRVVLGVADNKQIIGVPDPLSEEERICNLIADSIQPRLVPTVDLVTVEGKTLLIVEVFPSSFRPHFLKALGPENGVFIRLGSTNRQAGLDLIAELNRSAQGIVFDETPMSELDKSALDLDAAQELFANKRKLTDKALQTLKILKHEQGRLVPTHGGMLLFGKDRELYFPDAWVQCGRFRGTEKVHIFDQTEIYKPLPVALAETELFLQKHAFKSARFGALQREDVWSIPVTMLREVLVNALVHADYSQRGSPIRVAFFDNRIDVESPGLLMPGMTIDDMKSGVSRIRNPVIARVFRELQLVEQWGSGVKRIFDEAREQGLPEPGITEIATGIRFTVWLKEVVSVDAASSTTGRPGSEQAPNKYPASTHQVTHQVKTLLQGLEGDMDRAQLMAQIGLKDRGNFKHGYLDPALANGLIEMTQPDSPRSPTQTYRLTTRGKAVLAEFTQAKIKE
ncbi:MAG: helix-turn-helix domain-containing protein [Nitrococcus sp.]|nr:helix-turn-helix domain-containing protein [Nitrococcus sp.]